MSVLDDLVRAAHARAAMLPAAERSPEARRGPSLADALRGRARPALIAEIKRSSPSRDALRAVADPAATARALVAAGASALSVLTEPTRFGGSLEDLSAVAGAVDAPVLMKDFVVDERQVAAGASCGAAAVLLIVRVLPPARLAALLACARAHGLEALVECHDASETETAVRAGARVVGVNNRDLDRLDVDLARAVRLLPLVPASCVRVAESGYRTPADVASVRGLADAVLVGGALMEADDPARHAAELLR